MAAIRSSGRADKRLTAFTSLTLKFSSISGGQELSMIMKEDGGTMRGTAPEGWFRVLLRCPIFLYRVHMGWLLGHRFLLLTHIGRRSGTQRQTVLEVVRYERASRTCIVASGWGEQAQWLKNIMTNPDVAVTLGTRTHRATAQRLGRAVAEQEFRDYAYRHPRAVKQLVRFILGKPYQGRDEDFALLAEHVPLVELRAVSTAER